MNETLNPKERIKKKKEFLLIYKKGKHYKGKYFSLIYLSSDLSFSRIAIVASRKIGNAVQRNKIKRWIRNLFRKNKELLKSSVDIVIIPKKNIMKLSWLSLQQEYLSAIEFISRNNQSS